MPYDDKDMKDPRAGVETSKLSNTYVAKMFRESTEFDWWLNIDADNPPQGNPLDLIALNKDIIGCPTPIWQPENVNPIPWNVYGKEDGKLTEWKNYDGLQKVAAVGSGCMLFSRRVFENPPMQKGPFLAVYDEYGIRKLGPDIAFCLRAGEAGFEVWAHFDYICGHHQEVNLLDVMTHV